MEMWDDENGGGVRDIVGHTVGKSERDTRPPHVQTRSPAMTPRPAGRTLRAVIHTIKAGRVNDRGKGVIIDQLWRCGMMKMAVA